MLKKTFLVLAMFSMGAYAQNSKVTKPEVDTLAVRVDALSSKMDSLKIVIDRGDSTVTSESLKRDSFLRSQVENLQLQIDSIQTKLLGMKALEKQLTELQKSDSLRSAREAEQAALLAKRVEQFSKEYKDYVYMVDGFAVRFTPGFGWTLGMEWSKSDAVPDYKLDSAGRMDPLDLDRFAVWKDQKAEEMFRYGFFDIEASEWAATATTDWYFTAGAGLGGAYKGGFDGWFSEFGTGLGMLLGYCDLKNDKCYETDKKGREGSSLIALTTQVRGGWNFIPGHYFRSFRENPYLNTLGISASVMWRGVWGVAGFVEGEFTAPTDLTDAFFEENSAFVLGNIYRLELSLSSHF